MQPDLIFEDLDFLVIWYNRTDLTLITNYFAYFSPECPELTDAAAVKNLKDKYMTSFQDYETGT